MYVQGLTITMDDVVILQSNVVAVVEACGQARDAFFLVCSTCDVIERRRGAAVVRPAREQEVWLDDTSVQDVKCWRRLSNGYIEVLLPLV